MYRQKFIFGQENNNILLSFSHKKMKFFSMKIHIKYLFLFLLVYCGTAVLSQANPARKTYNFNQSWKLYVGNVEGADKPGFDDSKWKNITLPYAWNESEAFKNDIRDLSTGIAWYRKTFQLPERIENNKVFIEFEGVRQMGEVYLNGKFLGRSENGVMAFGFDLTPFLKPYPAENVIAVKTDNSWDYKEILTGSHFQWNDRNFNANYGGLPKNVFLHITPRVYQTFPLYSSLGTTGTYVYGSNYDIKARKTVVHVESQIKNESAAPVNVRLTVRVEDMNGKTVAAFPGDIVTLAVNGMREIQAADTLKNMHFWSWGYGYLYNVYADLEVDGKVIDEVKIRTGFRKTEFADGMIWLNDRVIMMKGYAQRTSNEWPSVGMSVPAWLSDYSNSLIVKGNGNMVRWMHVTPWKQDVESCDRVGLIEAMPAGDSEGDTRGRRWEQRKEVMRDAIIYNRNNPSILFYECGNEKISDPHMAEMKAIRDKYDPYGGRVMGSREMLDSKEAEYGGEMLYINKSADIPFWAMEYSRDEGLRKYWDNYTPPYHKDGDGPLYKGEDASRYNRNQDSHAIEDVVRWFDYWEMRPGTGKRVSSGGANIIFSDTNTHHRGEENYRRSGEVDPMRIPKENYFANKVIWNGWVDNDTADIHIIGHWNYDKGVVKDISVVSTADQVKLFMNGKSLGTGIRSKHFLFTFKDVAFSPGMIKAVGYDETGKEVCETEKTTAGNPAALKLSVMKRPGGMLADGSDLALVEVEVVDNEGNRCSTALNMINFTVNGSGEFIGGIAQGPDNYIGASSLPVECGVNRVFVRSTNKAGAILIKATSEGLKSASLTVNTHQSDIQSLSDSLPGAQLPSYLAKGPTPETSSYKISRIPVDVIGVKAVSNQKEAKYSYDDNEMTEWHNDGSLKTGIIEYELAREASINQVVMKLSGWRTRSYPVRVLVDNQEVFKGSTPRSLGYVTLTFPPVKGRKVRIELIGASSDNDAYKLRELSGKVDKAGLEDNEDRKGTLRIVEVEFYEPVAKSDMNNQSL